MCLIWLLHPELEFPSIQSLHRDFPKFHQPNLINNYRSHVLVQVKIIFLSRLFPLGSCFSVLISIICEIFSFRLTRAEWCSIDGKRDWLIAGKQSIFSRDAEACNLWKRVGEMMKDWNLWTVTTKLVRRLRFIMKIIGRGQSRSTKRTWNQTSSTSYLSSTNTVLPTSSWVSLSTSP